MCLSWGLNIKGISIPSILPGLVQVWLQSKKECTHAGLFVSFTECSISTHQKFKPVAGNEHTRMEKLLRKSHGLVISQETSASKDKQREMTVKC